MSEKSEYSPAESQMIMCIARERTCTPQRCLDGPCWLGDEVRESLNVLQAEWDKEKI